LKGAERTIDWYLSNEEWLKKKNVTSEIMPTIIKNNTDLSASLSLKSSKTITNKIHLEEDKNIILREQEQVYNLNNDSQTTFIKTFVVLAPSIFW
jgi:hypothetical protein